MHQNADMHLAGGHASTAFLVRSAPATSLLFCHDSSIKRSFSCQHQRSGAKRHFIDTTQRNGFPS